MPGTHHLIEINTPGRGFHSITAAVQDRIVQAGIKDGLCHCFIRHTSASLLITENADPQVLSDLERFIHDLVPDGDQRYGHQAEGPDDMPAHVRSVLTATTLTVPVSDGRLALGTWQGLFLWEHRRRPHQRRVMLTLQAF